MGEDCVLFCLPHCEALEWRRWGIPFDACERSELKAPRVPRDLAIRMVEAAFYTRGARDVLEDAWGFRATLVFETFVRRHLLCELSITSDYRDQDAYFAYARLQREAEKASPSEPTPWKNSRWIVFHLGDDLACQVLWALGEGPAPFKNALAAINDVHGVPSGSSADQGPMLVENARYASALADLLAATDWKSLGSALGERANAMGDLVLRIAETPRVH